MSARISIDGRLCDEGKGSISVLDRGFLYGDSVYEVMRTYGGRIFAGEEHLERLERSAALLEIAIPCGRAQLLDEMATCMASGGNAESYVRVIITRGSGAIGLDPALAEDPCRVIIVTRLPSVEPGIYDTGVGVYTIGVGRSAAGTLPAGAKSGNYLTNLLALRQARRQGGHEALLLDAKGRICEGSTSNIFAVIDGAVCTPPLDAGILEGITRSKVILLARSLGVPVHERELWPQHVHEAEEAFLTSTIREILPVTSVDDKAVGSGSVGPITRRLREAFTKLVIAV